MIGDDRTIPLKRNFDTSYGNSAFGAWTTDEFGLPAFRYDGCAAATGCVEPADAYHQLGNGHVTGVAHANGSVELFTAKTFYRYANRYDAKAMHFAGGFGWIREGGKVWSTFHDDRPFGSTYERLFGMGYFKKTIEHGGLRVEHYVYAAPGEDEALLERLRFTNLSSTAKTVEYFDYWDVAWQLVRYTNPTTSASAYDPAFARTSFDAARGALKVTSLAAAGDLNVESSSPTRHPRPPSPRFLTASPSGSTLCRKSFSAAGERGKFPSVSALATTSQIAFRNACQTRTLRSSPNRAGRSLQAKRKSCTCSTALPPGARKTR